MPDLVGTRRQLAPNPSVCRLLTDPEMERLRSNGLSRWYDPYDDCLTCGGVKSFRGPDGEGWDCDCLAQWTLYHWMLNAGINTEYQRLLWDDMTHVNLDAQDQVGEYITNLDYNIRIGRGLILWSKTPGTGKTLLGSLIVKRSLARGVDCYLTQFNEMLDIFTSGWRDEDERAWFIRRIRNVTLLAVDDIGKESGGRSNVVDSMFDTVMRHRVASGLPTLITTNLTPKEIQQGYGMYVMSLLSEQCEDIEVPGMDYRPKKREKNTMLAVNKIVRPFAADL